MKNKTVALAAVAALAAAPAAQAKKPEPKPAKSKGIAFTLKGTGLTALPVADGALTGALTLDPVSANKHARTVLTLTRADIEGTGTESFGVAGDKVLVRYNGLTATDALLATDVVKVQGKLTRTGKGKAKTLGTLDIRKITITREAAEPATGETQS